MINRRTASSEPCFRRTWAAAEWVSAETRRDPSAAQYRLRTAAGTRRTRPGRKRSASRQTTDRWTTIAPRSGPDTDSPLSSSLSWNPQYVVLVVALPRFLNYFTRANTRLEVFRLQQWIKPRGLLCGWPSNQLVNILFLQHTHTYRSIQTRCSGFSKLQIQTTN